MQDNLIKQLQEISTTLGKIIISVEPVTHQDWDAMEKMTAAHKQLRGIDMAELVEQPPRAAVTR